MINNKPQYFFIPTIPPQQVINKNNFDQETIPENNSENNTPDTTGKTNKSHVRNALLGSLIALSSITIPMIETESENKYINSNYNSYNTEETTKVICNPELIAKGGKNDSMIEISEFLNLLNFSNMSNLPKNQQSTIRMIASAHYTPIDITKPQAKEKLIEQVNRIQAMVDKSIENHKENPYESHQEKLAKINREYITASELINQVDFSEIKKYKKDVSILKAILKNSIQRIPRKDFDSNEKAQKAINQAQKFVNDQVKQYQFYGKIAGNLDYNSTLDYNEFLNLLNLSSLNGLDIDTQESIIKTATKDYKPIQFNKIKEDNKIKEKNIQIAEQVQRIQDIIDQEALKYKTNTVNI